MCILCVCVMVLNVVFFYMCQNVDQHSFTALDPFCVILIYYLWNYFAGSGQYHWEGRYSNSTMYLTIHIIN